MEYVCLYCNTSSTVAGNCGTDNHVRPPAKVWPTDAPVGEKISIIDFNPSTRHVAFDLHVCQATHEVLVVVRCKIKYEDFPGTYYPNRTVIEAPAVWTLATKTEFLRNLRASISLWDDRVQFRHNGVAYSPRFFISEVTTQHHVLITAKASAGVFGTINGGTERILSTALVTLAPPYSASRPSPSKGKIYKIDLITSAIAARMCLKDTALAGDAATQSHYCPMAHEFGHMLGIADEYNVFAFDTGNIPPASNYGDDGSSRCTVFWVQLLRAFELAAPAWGLYGTAHGQVNEHSIMRDVHALPGGFKKRHYVTVLEGLNHLTAYNATLLTNGAFTFVP